MLSTLSLSLSLSPSFLREFTFHIYTQKHFSGFVLVFSVMEKQRCKLCFKSFVNGRALGGHMRSHMMNLYVPPKPEQQQQQQHNDDEDDRRLGEEAESTPSSSSEEEENEEKGLLSYGLRENPKKSIRLVDPEFSFAGSSVVLQDRESETESSKNPTRRRSKRIRRSGIPDPDRHHCHNQTSKEPESKKPKSGQPGKPESPVSSISETSPEEGLAYCLLMLSRDKWVLRNEEKDEDEDEQTEYDSDEFKKQSNKTRIRGKYKCETCHRVFRSYQALGGHRASHKKNRAHNNGGSIREPPLETEVRVTEEKVHECPICYRVFASGQALGGHKRSHVIGSSSSTIITTTTSTVVATKPVKSKLGSEKLIDLNLPAPIDEDEISQVEVSVVSDAEFVNTRVPDPLK
ncbi:unnamed protein product [Camellia sinensis]